MRNGRYNKNPLDEADKAESRGFFISPALGFLSMLESKVMMSYRFNAL